MKFFRRFLVGLLAIALAYAGLVGLWYAEEDYRGARMWADTQHQLAARGESLAAADLIPPPIPDDQNLAMAPFFVRLYRYQVDPATKLLTFRKDNPEATHFFDAFPFGPSDVSSVKRPISPGWTTAEPYDLTRLQTYYRARPDFPHAAEPQTPADDVLLALTRYGLTLDELAREAAARPLVRFPVNWAQRPVWTITLPQGLFVHKINQTLRLRACAELAGGHPEAAARDVSLGLHLSHAIGEEPLLISNLIEVTCLNVQLQPVWEGLATQRWTASQLASLQTQLQKVDLLKDYQKSIRGERALFVVPTLADLRKPNGLGNLAALSDASGEGAKSSGWTLAIYRLFPWGWADRSVAITCQAQQTAVIDCVEATAHRVDAAKFKARMQAIETLPAWPTNVLVKITLPVYTSVTIKSVRTQAAVDEAFTACALEQYYLNQHAYPASLDALVPAYLPRIPTDVIDGAPMRYLRTSDGRYRLWEVGWNGRDEGGVAAWTTDGKRLDDQQGDWVWQYEPMAATKNEKH